MWESPRETATAEDADFVFRAWHDMVRGGDVEGLLALYTAEAVVESPLVGALFDKSDGVITGRDDLRAFFSHGTARRPQGLVRFWRTGEYCFDGRTLIWEYPRLTPEGEQLELVEVMELDGPRIAVHRIYWGWRGVLSLAGTRDEQVDGSPAQVSG